MKYLLILLVACTAFSFDSLYGSPLYDGPLSFSGDTTIVIATSFQIDGNPVGPWNLYYIYVYIYGDNIPSAVKIGLAVGDDTPDYYLYPLTNTFCPYSSGHIQINFPGAPLYVADESLTYWVVLQLVLPAYGSGNFTPKRNDNYGTWDTLIYNAGQWVNLNHPLTYILYGETTPEALTRNSWGAIKASF